MIIKKDTAYINGTKSNNMKVNGKIINNMGKVFIQILKE